MKSFLLALLVFGATATAGAQSLDRPLLLVAAPDLQGPYSRTAVLVVPAVLFAYGVGMLWSGTSDLGRRRTVEGQVLRRKEVIVHNDSGSSTKAVYLAVYDGNGGDVRALRCTPDVASGVTAGEVVRATISPHLAHVYSVERLGPMVSIHTGS